jgi:large subunit ribosomal protein L23
MKAILLQPVITEKYQKIAEKAEQRNRPNQYAFDVALTANKVEIKKAIEEKYNVKVESCRTVIRAAQRVVRYTKQRVIRGSVGRTKRAMVTLAPGQSINFYENV